VHGRRELARRSLSLTRFGNAQRRSVERNRSGGQVGDGWEKSVATIPTGHESLYRSTMRPFWTALLSISVGAVTSCGGGSDGFCEDFCTNHLACLDAAGTTTPLLCEPDKAKAQQQCVSACTKSTESMGDAQGEFLGCAECVVEAAGKEICDTAAQDRASGVTCSDACSTAEAGAAASVFRDDIDRLVFEPVCNLESVRFDASDARLAHGFGRAEGTSWVCDDAVPGTGASHCVYGPYLPIRAGSYAAIFRLSVDSPLANPGDAYGSVDVASGGTLAFLTLDGAVLGPGADVDVELPFVLEDDASPFEMRVSAYAATALMTVREIRLERR
jgi:hypothetical protein